MMTKYREALKFFSMEANEEFYNFQKDAPKGMFDNLNRHIEALNEAVIKAENYDKENLDLLDMLLDLFFRQCKIQVDSWEEWLDEETPYKVYQMTITYNKQSLEIGLTAEEYFQIQGILKYRGNIDESEA